MSAPTIERPVPVRPVVLAPRRRRLRIVLIVLGALLAAAVGWLVWFSPVLAVKSVRVVDLSAGDTVLGASAADQVLRAAAVPVGTPLARIDADAAQAAVASLPWVAGVEVRRGWPNEVVVAISPRVAVARIPDGKVVDATGTVFDAIDPVSKRLPMVAATGDGLGASVAVLTSLPPDLARRVLRVAASSLDDVTLTLRSGHLVRWGSADEPELKSRVLTALMKRKATMYDVSAPGLPTLYKAP